MRSGPNDAVLIVEDNYFTAYDLATELMAAGLQIVGPVSTIEKASALIRSERRITLAIIDIDLGGEQAYPVADALVDRHVPLSSQAGSTNGFCRGGSAIFPCA